jgi:hypothetical protein
MVKMFKDFDMDKHTIDTLNKYEDKPDIIVEEVIRKSPVPVPGYEGGATHKPDPSKGIIKPFDNLNPESYPVNQKEDLSMWDLMKKSARNEIKKGNHSEMKQIKELLHDDYKRSGGQWMTDDEKKLIGQYKSKGTIEPMKINLNLDITKNRLLVEKRREEIQRMKQSIDDDRKIFEKKLRRGENQGLAYLIDPKEKY